MTAIPFLRSSYWRLAGRLALYVIVIVGAVGYMLPLVWMVRTAVMPPWQVARYPIEWIPAEIHWDTWRKVWQAAPFGRFFGNTIAYTLISVLGTLFSSSLAAYAFARLKFRGRSILFILVLSTMMLPGQVTLIPRYLLFSRFGWINTYLPLLVPTWLGGSAFNIFLLRQYMMTIPLEYDDAAEIDGCSTMGIFFRIILPMSGSALGVIAIMHFTHCWNEFMGPLIYLNDLPKFTVAVGLQVFKTRMTVEMEQLMAATLVAIVPIIALFFIAQKHFIQGIVVSGVKG